MVGRLYHLGRAAARSRSRELLADFDLADAGDRLVRTYSGGMRRRLDLAAALVARPPVLFLDEPTTGLDIRSRIGLWEAIETLVGEGTTVLLTTQYLDEADRLADRIAVIDQGLVIAEGTSDELKTRSAASGWRSGSATAVAARTAVAALAPIASDAAVRRGRLGQRAGRASAAARSPKPSAAWTRPGSRSTTSPSRTPTLDDVFLQLTGHAAERGGGEE